MMKNDTVIIQHHSTPNISLVKSSMPKTLVYRTNKEFDKCADLLRSILNAQETRRDSPSSIGYKTNRKEKQQSSINIRPKKQNSKMTVTKSSFVKTNITGGTETGERRSSYSPNKISHPTTGATTEEPSLLKNRLSPNKSRKYITRSPSPTQTSHQRLISSISNNKSRQKSPPSLLRRRVIRNKEELVRSSSCSDLPSLKSSFMHKEQTRFILDQFITHLSRIRTISKQIRARNSNNINDSECYHLWNELEKSLSSAVSCANNSKQFQLSLVPLQSEIVELRKQLQTTNVYLHEYDLTRRNNEEYIHLQKKFDTNQIQCTQLLLYNEELKTKCQLLQDKLHDLERSNVHLIERLTQKNVRSIAQRTEWISTDNRLLLREEIIFLKEKLYHVYDDLATLFNRNHILQMSIGEQKKQLLGYEKQFNDLKQSAQYLLHDLDNRSIEEKVKRFLNNILIDQYHYRISTSPFHQTHITPIKTVPSNFNSPSFVFETPHKPTAAPSVQPATYRSHAPPNTATNKLRPKSLFVTPTILNDSKILSKFQVNQSPIIDITHCSSSTIDDADSTLTSSSSISLYYQQQKRNTMYNSLPSLIKPTNIDMTKTTKYYQAYNNDSGPELDEISNLTSKLFSSLDEEDIPIVDINISTTSSSSTMPSDAEKLIFM